jgi:perosamine synthetase
MTGAGEQVVVVGGGGHAKVVIDVLLAAGFEQVEEYLARRDEIAAWYRDELAALPAARLPAAAGDERSVCWLYSVVLPEHAGERRDAVMVHLRQAGIETRSFFYPCHTMPPYATGAPARCPRVEWLSERGLSLPTWIGMTRAHVRRIASALGAALAPCAS